jgi:hypothetical protein
MTPNLLSITRIFFQNDASTNPTVKFNYTITNKSTPNVSSRLLISKKIDNLWSMDNYILDPTKSEYMLELENNKEYTFTLENTTPGSPPIKEYGSIPNFLLNFSSNRPSVQEDETFFNSLSVNITPPEGLNLNSINYDLTFTVFDPSNNINGGIQTFDLSKNEVNSYHFCNLHPNTDHFITYNIKYQLNGIEYITKDSTDLTVPIKTTNTYGTLAATIEAGPSGTFGYYANGDKQFEEFNITWGINASDVNEDCSNNNFTITYTLDKHVSSSTVDPETIVSWNSLLTNTTSLTYNDTNPGYANSPMQFVYYRIKALLVNTSSVSNISWNSPFVYIGAPWLTKPVVPVLSVLHPDGDSAGEDADCIHVLVNGKNDDDQDTIQIQWNLVTGSTAKGGYNPLKFTYNNNDVLCDVNDNGILNVAISESELAKPGSMTISDYSVTTPNTYDDLNLLNSNNLSAGNTYVVGNTSINFIPYKSLVIQNFNVDNVIPSDYNVSTCVVDLSCNEPLNGLTGVDKKYDWYAVKVNLDNEIIGNTFELGTTFTNIKTGTVPSGDKYKFWVSTSQTYIDDKCQFTIATDSAPVYKVAEKLASAVPLTCLPNTPALDDISLNTTEITSQPDYNTYTVTLDTSHNDYQEPAPIDQKTFQIKKSPTNSVWTDLGVDVTTSTQVVDSTDNNITFSVRSSYVDAETSNSFFGAVNDTQSLSYILPPVIDMSHNLQLYSINNGDIGITVKWDLTSNHATNVVSYVVCVDNGSGKTFYKHVNDDYINGVVNYTYNISPADLTSVGVSYGNYVTIYITPYYKLNNKYYVGLTKQSPNILYRILTPTVNLSLTTPDDTNSSVVIDLVNLYSTWVLGGNILTNLKYEIQSKLASESSWSEYQLIDLNKLSHSNFSSSGSFTDFDSVKALINTNITEDYTNKINALDSVIKNNLLIYDLAGVYKNFQIKLTLTYSYTDETGALQTNSISDVLLLTNRNQPSNVSVIRTGSATSSTKSLIVTVKPNNSIITDYGVYIGPDPSELTTIEKMTFVLANLKYEYESAEPVPVSELDENGFVTFTINLNVYPASGVIVISNSIGLSINDLKVLFGL